MDGEFTRYSCLSEFSKDFLWKLRKFSSLEASSPEEAEILFTRASSKIENFSDYPKLKAIFSASVGIDHISVDEATNCGVLVFHCPTASSTSVAELCIGLMLGCVRMIPEDSSALSLGLWRRDELLGSELSGKQLGIIGLGRIGTAVSERARAFGMNIVAHDPYRKPSYFKERKVGRSELESLIQTSDIVSLHTPLTDETYQMCEERFFSQMLPGSTFINTARGALVQQSALYEALEQGHLNAAGLDVFKNEPPGSEEMMLIRHPQVIATSHRGARTTEAQTRLQTELLSQLKNYLEAGRVSSAVNAEHFKLKKRGRV